MWKFIFCTIIIFWLLRLLLKPFLKALVIKSAEQMAKNMQQQYNQQQRPRYPEGSIHVDRIPTAKGQKNGGQASKDEYIDFEEVK